MFKSKSHYKSRARVKRRARRIAKVTALVFLIIFVVGGAVLASRLDFLNIDAVEVSGNEVLAHEDLKAAVLESLEGNYLFFVPRTNTLLVKTGVLEEKLKEDFKRIGNIEVDRHGLQRISVKVTEREPFALWCKEGGAPCFFLDSEGLIFAPASLVSSALYLVFEGGVESDFVGTAFLPKADFLRLLHFVEGVETLGFPPRKVIAGAGRDFTLLLVSGAKIRFTLEGDLDKAYSNLQSVLADPTLGLSDSNTILAEYIDLRFGDKVFYKLGGDKI